MLNRIRRAAAVCTCLAMAGCTTIECCMKEARETADVTRYVIIGFGVVTVPKHDHSGIVATRAQALGFFAANQPGLKFGLGYSSSGTIAISPTIENAVVEVGSCTSDGIKINTHIVTNKNF